MSDFFHTYGSVYGATGCGAYGNNRQKKNTNSVKGAAGVRQDMEGNAKAAGAGQGGRYRKTERASQEADIGEGKEGVEGNRTQEWMGQIAERKREIVEKVRRGETEPSIPIGAASFTYKQWNKLMQRVDRAIEDMQERIQAEEEEAKTVKVKKKEAGSISKEMLEELLGIEIKGEGVLAGGSLFGQIGSGERMALDNAYYSIQPAGSGLFRITDKKTGMEYTFAEAGCSLKQDKSSGRIFLMPSGDYAQTGSVLAADETLVSSMAQYFGVESLETGVLSGYSFSRNEETGIEIMIPQGMEGRKAYMLFQSREDVEAYERLAQTYQAVYPNLAQNEAMAKFYAGLEVEGLCHRTATGILYTNADGVGYADENNPEKNWWLSLQEQTGQTYEMLLGMLDDIKKEGKDIGDMGEWQERLERKQLEYEVLEKEWGVWDS